MVRLAVLLRWLSWIAFAQGAKLEVDMVIREVCDRIIYDAKLDKEVAMKRVAALTILGEVYQSVKKEGSLDPMQEYIKLDKK